MASTFESKALNWPSTEPEDGTALRGFSIYLASCRNAIKGSQLQHERKMAPCGWPYHRVSGKAFKTRSRRNVIDREAKIATNPVFEKDLGQLEVCCGHSA